MGNEGSAPVREPRLPPGELDRALGGAKDGVADLSKCTDLTEAPAGTRRMRKGKREIKNKAKRKKKERKKERKRGK